MPVESVLGIGNNFIMDHGRNLKACLFQLTKHSAALKPAANKPSSGNLKSIIRSAWGNIFRQHARSLIEKALSPVLPLMN
jgi:hypothetical protein